MTKTSFLNNYILFYEESYTTKEFLRSIRLSVSNRAVGQILRKRI